jgi:hypothetical protein
MDLSECTYSNFLFSPNLQYYLDYDKDDNMFVIKKTIDQSNYRIIPQGLMNPAKENVKLIVRRFKWVDNQRIRIMNREGFQKTIDINDGFREISYCSVPMIHEYNYLRDDSIPGHYFFDMTQIPEDDNRTRLMRKY